MVYTGIWKLESGNWKGETGNLSLTIEENKNRHKGKRKGIKMRNTREDG